LFRIEKGIARGDAIEIDSAKSLVGMPVWGNGPAIVRRLRELCDEGHILLDLIAYENFITKRKKELEHLLSSQTSSQFFQDLGEYLLNIKSLYMSLIFVIIDLMILYLFLEIATFQ
jgi:hypothetical protein